MSRVHEDKAEIIEVLNLYAFLLDSHQWDMFDLVFTEDVETVFGPASAAWPDLDTLKSAFRSFHEILDNHAHMMMGHLVHVDGDKASAFTYGNWLLVRNNAEGGPSWLGTGWYDDEFVRTDQGWRISRRRSRLTSYSGNPDVPQPVGDQTPDHTGNSVRGAADVGDIWYLSALKGE